MTNPYVKTLRRIPKEIRLAMATRDFDMGSPNACLCGWAIRESLAFANGKTADEYEIGDGIKPGTTSFEVANSLARSFGGDPDDWRDIYWTAGSEHPDGVAIEEAFVQVVQEACR